jgi:hypothetical protein
VPLCPAKPPTNGDLTDQGEQVGRIGASSSTFADDAGIVYCAAVLAAARHGRDVVVTVRVVNHGSRTVDVGEGEDQLQVTLSYGSSGQQGLESLAGARIQGVVPPGGVATGTYAFEVPAGQTQVRVSAGPAGAAAVWAGTVH